MSWFSKEKDHTMYSILIPHDGYYCLVKSFSKKLDALQHEMQGMRETIDGQNKKIEELEKIIGTVNITITDERTIWKGIDITCQK
jgi:hypothetical protein